MSCVLGVGEYGICNTGRQNVLNSEERKRRILWLLNHLAKHVAVLKGRGHGNTKVLILCLLYQGVTLSRSDQKPLCAPLWAAVDVFSPLYRVYVKMTCNIANTRWNLETLSNLRVGLLLLMALFIMT